MVRQVAPCLKEPAGEVAVAPLYGAGLANAEAGTGEERNERIPLWEMLLARAQQHPEFFAGQEGGFLLLRSFLFA